MKIEVEFRSDMSRAETFKALRITLEACARLAHRMSPAELQKVENFGAALIAVADTERKSRRESLQGVAQINTFRIETFDPEQRGIEFAGGDGPGDRGGAAGVTAF
ncbi:MAG: hypothetical protein ACOZAA_09595 [Pseudomonadota bacterium]